MDRAHFYPLNILGLPLGYNFYSTAVHQKVPFYTELEAYLKKWGRKFSSILSYIIEIAMNEFKNKLYLVKDLVLLPKDKTNKEIEILLT
ncbi:MAG: hypothetical protein ACREOB_03595, partial [Thermodesulfobacteriota bacterium]